MAVKPPSEQATATAEALTEAQRRMTAIEAQMREAHRALDDEFAQAKQELDAAAAGYRQQAEALSPAVLEFLRAIHEAGLEPSALDPAVIRRVVLRTVATQAWERELGTLFTSAQAGELLGVSSRQGIEQRLKQHRLIGIQAQNKRWQIPAFQFINDEPATALVDAFWTLNGSASGWTAAAWCTSPHPELEGLTPVRWVQRALEPQRLATVASRDAARLAQ